MLSDCDDIGARDERKSESSSVDCNNRKSCCEGREGRVGFHVTPANGDPIRILRIERGARAEWGDVGVRWGHAWRRSVIDICRWDDQRRFVTDAVIVRVQFQNGVCDRVEIRQRPAVNQPTQRLNGVCFRRICAVYRCHRSGIC